MVVAWVFSTNHRNINWRVIFWGVLLQLIFAFIVFWMPVGIIFFRWINAAVIKLFSFAKEGMYFLFGPLAVSPGTIGPGGERSIGFILAFQALPTIIFFAALMAILYHIRLMPLLVRAFARVFTKLMRVSGAESLCAASNIFVGIESIFTIRPYLEKMTRSELCTVLTVGMATVASTVLAIYVGFLHHQFPAVAGHLVSASILSAPAAIVMSKLLLPETERPVTLGKVVESEYLPAASWVEAIIRGATEGAKLCVGICAMLLAFLGLLAMVNWALGGVGRLLGSLYGVQLNLSLQGILSYVFYPLTFLAGVPFADVPEVARVLGERAIVTELVSYRHLASLIDEGVLLHPRSVIIATYALCGFAHIASLSIFVGGISAIAPKCSRVLARVGFRALAAATLACLMTGAVAGVFFRAGETILMGGH
ncbi:nucleoside transporter [candidate division NPL-UPA2 bacterium]|nr:nucleoside transporter [candidate division NPL-UPA2 bacterium]